MNKQDYQDDGLDLVWEDHIARCDKLNLTLAEGFGFKYFNTPTIGFRGISYECGWLSPDGVAHSDAPDFTQSPSACFKWIEPELYRRRYRYRLIRLQDGHLMEITKPNHSWAEIVAHASHPEVAMAFCLAVEKLIDGGKK